MCLRELNGILITSAPQPDTSCSSSHAALVHHEDGRLFIIDLQSVSPPSRLPHLRSAC